MYLEPRSCILPMGSVVLIPQIHAVPRTPEGRISIEALVSVLEEAGRVTVQLRRLDKRVGRQPCKASSER